jgi:hypothetical protein
LRHTIESASRKNGTSRWVFDKGTQRVRPTCHINRVDELGGIACNFRQ